jgi:hypothetical protein
LTTKIEVSISESSGVMVGGAVGRMLGEKGALAQILHTIGRR